MKEWRVQLEYRVRGYVTVKAASAEEAKTIVASGDYDDFFGEESFGGIEIVDAALVSRQEGTE